MLSNWGWMLLRLSRRLWFRAALISMLAVAAAVVAVPLTPFLPEELPNLLGARAVDNILTIIASSMLAVTTFSLSATVQAYASATSSVTPRATKLLIEDATTQNVLATFLGAFLFSLIGIILLSIDAYGERGRLVLFFVTILVVLLIVVTLLRWIDYLLRLGRVGETTDQVERAATAALRGRLMRPHLGGRALVDPAADVPAGARPVRPHVVGYVQHVDIEGLSDFAEDGGEVFVVALPGAFVDRSAPLAHLLPGGEEDEARVRACFSIAHDRTFDQDPRFGLSVMAEIASRALSPAINDPGTAIDILGRSVRILSLWAEGCEARPPDCPRVHVPGLTARDLIEDVFLPIARDGAEIAEVQIRLQKALLALARAGDGRLAGEARRISAMALARAEGTLTLPYDLDRVREAAAAVDGTTAR
jgi:uncharacterized membrane protein